MTNLHSILKSRQITLLAKIHLVKAMIFSVVMYRCESWTIKNAECQRTAVSNCGAGEDFENPLDYKDIKQFNTKGNQAWKFIEELMLKLKLQIFGHLMQQLDSLEKTLMLAKTEGKRKRGMQRMWWLDSITESMDMNLSKLWETVKDRKSLTCWSAWGCIELDMTEWLNNNNFHMDMVSKFHHYVNSFWGK